MFWIWRTGGKAVGTFFYWPALATLPFLNPALPAEMLTEVLVLPDK